MPFPSNPSPESLLPHHIFLIFSFTSLFSLARDTYKPRCPDIIWAGHRSQGAVGQLWSPSLALLILFRAQTQSKNLTKMWKLRRNALTNAHAIRQTQCWILGILKPWDSKAFLRASTAQVLGSVPFASSFLSYPVSPKGSFQMKTIITDQYTIVCRS